MPTIDLLIGLQAGRINTAIAQVFQNQTLRDKIFSGTQTGDFENVSYTASFQLNSAPGLEFRSPTTDEWNNSIKENGNPGIPVANPLIVNLPSLTGGFTSGGQSNQSTFPLKVICSASNNGNKIALTAYSVIVNLSGLSPIDAYVITNFLIPAVLSGIDQTLAGLTIPIPSFAGVSLTPPSVAISGSTLVIAFNLVQDAQPNLQGYPIPPDSFFVLASQALVQAAVNYVTTQNIQGQTFNKSGSTGAAGFGADYSVSGNVNSITVQTTNNPVQLHATVDFGLAASAGIDLPFGYILQGGEIIWDGLKDAGNTIIHALDPSNW
jgi:hypothetical protein